MKCNKCGNCCEKLKRKYYGKWRECWYCVHCKAIYTLVEMKCRKCGAFGLILFTRRLRERDKIVNEKIYFGSIDEPFVFLQED